MIGWSLMHFVILIDGRDLSCELCHLSIIKWARTRSSIFDNQLSIIFYLLDNYLLLYSLWFIFGPGKARSVGRLDNAYCYARDAAVCSGEGGPALTPGPWSHVCRAQISSRMETFSQHLHSDPPPSAHNNNNNNNNSNNIARHCS